MLKKNPKGRQGEKPLSKPQATSNLFHRAPNEPAVLTGHHQSYQEMFREALNRSFIRGTGKAHENA